MYDEAFKYQSHIPLFCLVWWGVTTWPIGWCDPFSIWCNLSIFLFPCLVHVIFDVLNFYLSFIKFIIRCLRPSWTMLSNMTSLVTTETCGLTQPSLRISTEIYSSVVHREISIFLTIMTTISCIIIPIVRVSIASYLVWWPCGLVSVFKGSMSILLIVVIVSYKFGTFMVLVQYSCV